MRAENKREKLTFFPFTKNNKKTTHNHYTDFDEAYNDIEKNVRT